MPGRVKPRREDSHAAARLFLQFVPEFNYQRGPREALLLDVRAIVALVSFLRGVFRALDALELACKLLLEAPRLLQPGGGLRAERRDFHLLLRGVLRRVPHLLPPRDAPGTGGGPPATPCAWPAAPCA